MTDRDLFYCTDFQCDGHARSNETCLDPETLLPIPGCKPECSHPHCDYDPEVDGQHRHPDMPAAPKYTVSGNHMRVFRLDTEGNPVGAAVDFPGAFSFDLDPDEVADVKIDWPTETVTIDLEMGAVDPALLALLTGQGTPPEEVEFIDTRSRWQRFVDWVKYWAREWTP